MSRLVLVQTQKGSQYLPNFTVVSASEIDSIVNYSVDHICCYDIEFLSPDESDNLLNKILDKVRPSGIVTIGITNTKKICRDYYMNSIDDLTYIQYHAGHRSVFSENKMIQALERDKNIKTVKLEYTNDQLQIVISAQRTSV